MIYNIDMKKFSFGIVNPTKRELYFINWQLDNLKTDKTN